MVISELALGLITNLLYDSAKKTPGIHPDPSSKAYENAIKELNKKYRLSKGKIDNFLRQENVKVAIKEYLENPNDCDFFKSLTDEFLVSLGKDNFSREYAKSILNTFFEILDHEIEKDTDLRDYLKLYLSKQIYQGVQELSQGVQEITQGVQGTNQGVQILSQGLQEMSERVLEIHAKVVNDNKMDQTFKKEPDIDFEESVKEYLNRIIAEDNDIGISEVYTELSAKEILPITLKFHDEKSDKKKEFKVLELVKKEEKLIISGESGSGKTTTLKWLNFIYATNYLENEVENIPLYIELNSYIKGSFYNYVRIRSKRKGISEATLKRLLEGKVIILLDGLDLLSTTDNFFPYDEIYNFVSEYSNCRFIISSRPGFFESIKSDFKVSELEKLTDEKIMIFIYKYVPDKKIGEMIKSKILTNMKLKSIVTTPMMLYLAIEVAMQKKENNEDLFPSNRSEMYETFISGLFTHYEDKKGKAINANRAQIENFLTDYFFELQCKNKVSCKEKEALGIVKKHAEDNTFRKTSSQDILEDCFKIGLLTRKNSVIEYGIHQSFQEYFAAIKLKEQFENGFDVSEAFNQPKWEEVVIFTSEMVDSSDKFITSMLLKGNLFLASKCVSKASDEIKEKIFDSLTDKMELKYKFEKINVIESLERIGDIGINTIAKLLRDENEDVMRSAAKALGNIKSEKVVQLIIDALKDEDADVRSYAACILGEMDSEKAVQPLIDALDDENKDVRQEAAEALGEIQSEKAVIPLINAIKDKNENKEVRSKASSALQRINNDIAEQLLIELLNDENEDLYVRWDAVRALGDIESEKAVLLLVKALKDKDLGNIASIVLNNFESETTVQLLINELNIEDLNSRHIIVQTLANICSSLFKEADSFSYCSEFKKKSESVVQLLIDASKNEDRNVRRGITEVLLQIQYEIPPVQQLLINALKDKDEELRVNAAFALSHIKSEAAVQSLIGALKDKSEFVRYAAASSLGQIKSEKAVQPLIDALKDDSEFVRSEVVSALGDIKSEKAVQPLINLLKNEDVYEDVNEDFDEDEDLRVSAAIALGDIESEAAVQPLINLLKDEKGTVRWSAVVALGDIKSETAVQPLIDALNDEIENVRSEAVRALGNIKSEAAVRQLLNSLKDENENVLWGIVAALGNIKSELSITPLINLLKNENEDVQWSAAYALCNFKSKHAMQLLIDVMKDESEPKSVRERIAKMFMWLNSSPEFRVGQSETIVQLLTNILKDKNDFSESEAIVKLLGNVMKDKDKYVRLSVVEALGNIGSETAVQVLITALNDEDESVQKKTADVLRTICTVKNKKQFEELMKSKHEFSVNTAFEILDKIEYEEESKIVLFGKDLHIN
jgi:HEAT repeat protein/energy-coupling factor transporter ATP-binding protein EcfA2